MSVKPRRRLPKTKFRRTKITTRYEFLIADPKTQAENYSTFLNGTNFYIYQRGQRSKDSLESSRKFLGHYITVGLGVMVRKVYSTFYKALALEPHHHVDIPRIFWGGSSYPFAEGQSENSTLSADTAFILGYNINVLRGNKCSSGDLGWCNG